MEHAKNPHSTKRGPGRYHASVPHGNSFNSRTAAGKQQPTGKSGPSPAQIRMAEKAEANRKYVQEIKARVQQWNARVNANKEAKLEAKAAARASR